MARKKDLAGLAALAGLAYMMTRDKAQKGLAPVEDGPKEVPGTYKAKPTKQVDPYEVRDDDGTLSTFRRNEYGELYNPTGSSTASPASVSKSAATRSVAAPKAADGTAPLVYKDDFGMGKMAPGTGKQFPGGLGTRISTLRADDNRGRRTHPEYMEDTEAALKRDAQVTARDLVRGQKGYAKGGSVKGWGMARGARKAKTY